jgi:hypothetical protein
MPDISAPFEVDTYAFHLLPNTDYTATVAGSSTGGDSGLTLPDPFIAVVDLATQSPITYQDTSAEGSRDPVVFFQVPAERDYVVGVADLTGRTGSYEVAVSDQSGISLAGVPAGEFIFDPLSMTLTPL